jgi:hypothetical protein
MTFAIESSHLILAIGFIKDDIGLPMHSSRMGYWPKIGSVLRNVSFQSGLPAREEPSLLRSVCAGSFDWIV